MLNFGGHWTDRRGNADVPDNDGVIRLAAGRPTVESTTFGLLIANVELWTILPRRERRYAVGGVSGWGRHFRRCAGHIRRCLPVRNYSRFRNCTPGLKPELQSRPLMPPGSICDIILQKFCSRYALDVKKDTSSGSIAPKVVFCGRPWPLGPIAWPPRAIRWRYWAKYCKNERRRAADGQTESGSMAVTRYFDSMTPTSYSTPYTLAGAVPRF